MTAVLPRRPLAGRSDAVLVELISDGDEEAFETLVRRYWKELLIYSDRLLGAEGRAEDACQQALLQAWLALRAGTEVDDVRPWLYRIVHNSAVTILRRAHHETVELNEALDSPASDATADSRIILGEIFDRLSAMPEPQREAIVMTAVRGCSQAETAAKLGLTDGAVRGLIYRARASLRSAVAGLLPVGLMNWWGRAGSRHVSLAGDASDAAGGAGAAGTAGAAGLAAAVVKGGAVLAAAGVLAGTGTVIGSIVNSAGHRPPTHVRRPARPAGPTRHAVVGMTRAGLSAGPAVIAVESRRSDRSDGSGTERGQHRGGRGPDTSRGGHGPSSNERGGEFAQGSDGGGQDSGRGKGTGASGKTGDGGGTGPGASESGGSRSGSGNSAGATGSTGSGSGSGSGGGSGDGAGSGSGGGSPSSSGEH